MLEVRNDQRIESGEGGMSQQRDVQEALHAFTSRHPTLNPRVSAQDDGTFLAQVFDTRDPSTPRWQAAGRSVKLALQKIEEAITAETD